MTRKSKATKTPQKTRNIQELLEATTSQNQEEEVIQTEIEEMAEDENDHLCINDFLGRQSRGYQSGIRVPEFQANNFEIKQTMLKMLELQAQYAGNNSEDPNRHLIQFLDVCNCFKQNGVPNDVIRLWLFPYSLQGKAKE